MGFRQFREKQKSKIMCIFHELSKAPLYVFRQDLQSCAHGRTPSNTRQSTRESLEGLVSFPRVSEMLYNSNSSWDNNFRGKLC